jgi:serine protease Do
MYPRVILPAVLAGLCLVVLPTAVQAKGYLGVQIRLNPDGKGILIMEIMADSAAEKAKLKPKDVILKIDGTEPTSLKEFISILDLKQPGDEVTLDILRDGKEEKVKVTLGKMGV